MRFTEYAETINMQNTNPLGARWNRLTEQNIFYTPFTGRACRAWSTHFSLVQLQAIDMPELVSVKLPRKYNNFKAFLNLLFLIY